jgi:hypothetical protein
MYWWWNKEKENTTTILVEKSVIVDGTLLTNGVHPIETALHYETLMWINNNLSE